MRTPVAFLAFLALLVTIAHTALAQPSPVAPSDDDPPLILAAEAGDLEAVQKLIEEGADLDVNSERLDYTRGWTPLLYALRHRHTDVARALLDAGASVKDEYLSEPIYQAKDTVYAAFVAARYADRELMDMVIQAGADYSIERVDSDSLLHLACLNDDPELVHYLIHERDIDPNAVNEQGQTPLMFACRWERTFPGPLEEDFIPRDQEREIGKLLIMNELIVAGAVVDRFDSSGRTALLVACTDGLRSQVQFLLEQGAQLFDDPDLPVYDPVAQIHYRTIIPEIVGAAQSGDRGTIDLLIEQGADLNATGQAGVDLLEIALNHANALVIPELLEIGFDPNAADDEGRSPLMRACLTLSDTSRRRDQFRGHVPSAKALLEAGADVSATDPEGRTVLHYAAGSAVPELIQLLLDAGADPTAKDKAGLTPLDYTKDEAPRLTRYRVAKDRRAIGAATLEKAIAQRGDQREGQRGATDE